MKKLLLALSLILSYSCLLADQQATLSGSIGDIDLKEIRLEAISTVAIDQAKESSIPIGPNGVFYVTLDIPPSQQFKLHIGSLTLPLYLEPADSLNISLLPENLQLKVKFSGEGSTNNTFFFQYNLFEQKMGYGELETALQQKDATAYWDAAHKLNEVKQKYFDQYVEKSKKELSPNFFLFIQNQIQYQLVDQLLTFYTYYQSMIDLKVVSIPANYKTYLDEINLNDDTAIQAAHYQLALINLINFKNKGSYGQFIEDQLKELADKYKLAGDALAGTSQYYAQYIILQKLLKSDYVYATFEYEDFLKGGAPKYLKDPISRLFQIKSMTLDGLPMPNLQLLDQNGNITHIGDFKSKITYLCLWKNDNSTAAELSRYFLFFKNKVTQDTTVSINTIFTAKSDKIWKQVLAKQKKELPYLNHYRLDYSDELTRSFVLRTDDYGPLFILIDRMGKVLNGNAGPSYEYNPNAQIRKLLNKEAKAK